MSEIRKWLEGIGLGQYGDAFEANKIDMDLLGQVDDQILKDIGVSAAGDRLRIRNAIAKLAAAPVQRVKALGEPIINRGQKIVGLLAFALNFPVSRLSIFRSL
jgi:SAM domain (Sterile alpha motif)